MTGKVLRGSVVTEKEAGVRKQLRKNGRSEGGGIMLPKDPAMLLSFVNMKLRDFYGNLEVLCDELDVNRQDIAEKLAEIGYHYDKERNQFV